MTDPASQPESRSDSNPARATARPPTGVTPQPPATTKPTTTPPDAPVDPKTLTPEEQMALFEKDLKENDWGHQPC